MATSGTYTYNVNKQSLIKDALIEATVITDDQEVSGEMYAWVSRRLNAIIKRLQAKGLHLWTTREVTLLLEANKIEYTLGPNGDRCAEDVVRAVTTTATAIAATTYDVVSTGMAVADVVGIEMTDGEMHWSTIATIPDAASITVAVGPTTAAVTGAVVYTYTTIIPKPLRIHEAYVQQKSNEDSHIPITIVPREEYLRLNSKQTSGVVVQIYFNPERTESKLKVWPTSSDNIQRLTMTAELPLDNMDLATDDLAFPDWWFDAMHLTLAHACARSYMVPIDKVRELKTDAKEAVQEAEDFNVESTYIEMVPTVKWAG